MIIPAIDFIEGQVVRLKQGDFQKSQNYNVSVEELLESYREKGASLVHLVDLEGAKNPEQRQWNLIKEWLKRDIVDLQIGGGFRNLESIETALELGVKRVVVSSLFVESPALARKILSRYSEKIVFAADLRFVEDKAFIATRGWQDLSQKKTAYEWIRELQEFGLCKILSTDISKDGLKEGPNTKLYQELRDLFPNLEIIASGGVSSLSDIQALKKAQVSSMVVGKALLDQDFTYEEAQKCWLKE